MLSLCQEIQSDLLFGTPSYLQDNFKGSRASFETKRACFSIFLAADSMTAFSVKKPHYQFEFYKGGVTFFVLAFIKVELKNWTITSLLDIQSASYLKRIFPFSIGYTTRGENSVNSFQLPLYFGSPTEFVSSCIKFCWNISVLQFQVPVFWKV